MSNRIVYVQTTAACCLYHGYLCKFQMGNELIGFPKLPRL